MSEEYEVGYGKPPHKGQFKKGQSGNPKGRPKGTKDFKTDLMEELGEKLMIKEAGVAKTVSKQRAMIKALMAKAIQGDARASTSIMTMLLRFVPDDASMAEEVPLSETDQMILAEFLDQSAKQKPSKGPKNAK